MICPMPASPARNRTARRRNARLARAESRALLAAVADDQLGNCQYGNEFQILPQGVPEGETKRHPGFPVLLFTLVACDCNWSGSFSTSVEPYRCGAFWRGGMIRG